MDTSETYQQAGVWFGDGGRPGGAGRAELAERGWPGGGQGDRIRDRDLELGQPDLPRFDLDLAKMSDQEEKHKRSRERRRQPE
jgi:hypothetical protein